MASHTLQSTFFVHFSITPPKKRRKHLVLIRRKSDHLSFVSAPFSKSPFSILDIMFLLKEGHFLPDAFCLLLLFTVSWRLYQSINMLDTFTLHLSETKSKLKDCT